MKPGFPMNDKFQKALKRQAQKVPPIWLMRQAGRYHSHYQKLREKHSFMDLCKIPELAAETARGPVADFDFDVAILFSDLLFPLEALGMGLSYEDTGPQLGWHLSSENLSKLHSVSEALPKLSFQRDALKATREVLPKDKSLIGFVGGPWTLFSYACQGTHSGGLQESKRKLQLFDPFMDKLMPLLIENIRLQKEGGAEVVMIFDTAAGEVSSQLFQEKVSVRMKELALTFPDLLGYYSKGTVPDHLGFLSEGRWAGAGFDHRWNLTERLKSGRAGFVQGNFDQNFFFLDTNDFKKVLDTYLRPLAEMSPDERKGWVAGLGHGVLPKTPEAHVRYYVEKIRDVFSK
jgi:uroporphyrinogen decarboxylase